MLAKHMSLCSLLDLGPNPDSFLMGCVILDKSFNLSDLHFAHLENGYKNAL